MGAAMNADAVCTSRLGPPRPCSSTPRPSGFLACPVALKDIRPPQPSDTYPAKVKALGLCAPCFEVDRRGNPIQPQPTKAEVA